MTQREIEKIIRDDGWEFVGQRGSHKQFEHPVKPGRVTIPAHKGDLNKGTANSILKQAGIKGAGKV